jgi:hypothetical protein
MSTPTESESSEETLHLLRDPANAERLLRSIREAEEGKLLEHEPDESSPVRLSKTDCGSSENFYLKSSSPGLAR